MTEGKEKKEQPGQERTDGRVNADLWEMGGMRKRRTLHLKVPLGRTQ